MIVVKIELWPRGNEDNKRQIGEIRTANDATGTNSRGNYDGMLFTKHRNPRVWKRGRVVDFPRQRMNVYDLLLQILRSAIGDRNPE